MKIERYNYCPDDAMRVRIEVFVDEQGFRDEFDEIDSVATHLLMRDNDGLPIATCRVFKKDNDTYAIGRLAVVGAHRGKGLGQMLMREAEICALELGGKMMILHSQCRAQGFYEKCGFAAYGEMDYEEDCPHIWMKKALPRALHEMKLHSGPFELIAARKKKIELRLYDEKRQNISVGDIIRFARADNCKEILLCRVENIHIFTTFKELYDTLPLKDCGYTDNNADSARHTDMLVYYSEEQQRQYGVCGIEIHLL